MPFLSLRRRPAATFNRVLLSLLLFLVLFAGTGVGGFYLGRRSVGYNQFTPSTLLNVLGKNNQPPATKVDFNLFWQAWNIVNSQYYGGAGDDQKKLDGAISGMVASLGDPYTVYLPPQESQVFLSDLSGSFGGIGAELAVKNGQLVIIAALDGTPADKGGLKAQDVILEIDGHSTSELNFGDAIDKIRGPKGSQVELTIGRQGMDKPFKVKLTRDTIVVKSVKSQAIGPNNEIAYIKINLFGDDTYDLFRQALQDAKDSNKKGIVVDLRNDPGGQLVTVEQVIGLVIPKDPDSSNQKLRDRVAVLERDKNGHETDSKAPTDPLIPDLPMTVVVNGGSASASEIFAGAMKDYGRATVIGTKTFGKGSVQQLENLENGGTIKVTIAKWFTPLGVGIDGKGIDPDVTVALPDNTEPSTSDVQISKAVELLQSKIK